MYSERRVTAFEWASRLHATQVRKGSEAPYLSHLLGVASLVIEYGGDEDAVIAGLLHDVVEDCGGRAMLDEIGDEFGAVVAATVAECSDNALSDGEAKPPWEQRKRDYIAAVRFKSARACLVTACDKLHNANAIIGDDRHAREGGGTPVWERFSGKPREQTVACYTAISAALQGLVPPALGALLANTVAELRDLADLSAHDIWVDRLLAAE